MQVPEYVDSRHGYTSVTDPAGVVLTLCISSMLPQVPKPADTSLMFVPCI